MVAAMSSLYPENLGVITALYEFGFSLALTIGPYLGGSLYNASRFYLPFVVTGTISIISGVITILLMSTTSKTDDKFQSDYRVSSFPTVILGLCALSFIIS